MTDALFLTWLTGVSALVVLGAMLLLRCFLRSHAVERRIRREIDEIWGD